MDESMWERYGAAAGIIFVVLLMLTLFLAPQPPHVDAATAKIAAYYAGHRRAILAEQMFGTFAIVFFVWFAGHLRHVLQRAENGTEALSPIVFGAAVALAGAGALAALPAATLAFAAHRPEVIGDAGLVRALYDMYLMVGNVLLIMCGLFVAATAAAMVRGELGESWLGWAGMAVAIVDWVGGGAGFFVSTYSAFWTAVGLVGFLGFAAFVLVAAAAMVRQPEVSRSAAPRPVFGH